MARTRLCLLLAILATCVAFALLKPGQEDVGRSLGGAPAIPPPQAGTLQAAQVEPALPAPVERRPTETPTASSQVQISGTIVHAEDERPVAQCKVLLFMVAVPDTYERIAFDELEPWITWTDPSGKFSFAVDSPTDTEWRGMLHAYYPGLGRAGFPLPRLEPNRPVHLPLLSLSVSAEPEVPGPSRNLRGMVRMMELLRR